MIEDTFLKLKSNLELTQTFQDTISRSYNAVKAVVENNHNGVKRVVQIGSVGRKTRIQPTPGTNASFDIDMLVVLGEFDRWVPKGQGISKEMAMESVESAVKSAQRYASKNPERDNPTVTFAYENGVTIELVPAYIDKIGKMPDGGPTYTPAGRAFWVPSRTGWQLADYEYEAAEITRVNGVCNGMLIPAVKMLKAAKRKHFPSMSSYHLEVIASQKIPDIIKTYEKQGVAATYPKIVASMLFHLDGWLDQEWNIPGSLSPTFSVPASAKAELQRDEGWLRKTVGNAYNAKTDAEARQLWKLIFPDELPLT